MASKGKSTIGRTAAGPHAGLRIPLKGRLTEKDRNVWNFVFVAFTYKTCYAFARTSGYHLRPPVLVHH